MSDHPKNKQSVSQTSYRKTSRSESPQKLGIKMSKRPIKRPDRKTTSRKRERERQ